MKKLITTAFILSLASGSFAQGFYLKLGLGYAFPEAGQTLDGTGTPYNGTIGNNNAGTIETYSMKSASFSAGFQGGLGLGYMFTDHVGVELDGEFGLSSKKYTFEDDNVNIGSGVLGNVSIIQQAKTPITVIPSLVVQTGGDPWNIYCRMGLAVPVSTKITQDQVYVNGPGTGAIEIDDYTFKIKNSFSLGFAAAAGVQYKLNDRVCVWGEVSLLSMSVYIKESDLTGVTSNGQSVSLSQVSGPQTVKYSKNTSVDSTGSQEAAYSQPFSNLGINVGISFRLGNQPSSKSHHGQGRGDDDLIDNSKPYRRH